MMKFFSHELANPFHDSLPPLSVVNCNFRRKRFVSSGKGFSTDERLLSAYGEVLERLTMWNVEAVHNIAYSGQKDFVSPNLFYPEWDLASEKIEWLETVMNGSSERFFVHRPIRGSRRKKYFSHTSNGCAVGMGSLDATSRAKSEILERHIFLSRWLFQNLTSSNFEGSLPEDAVFSECGWQVHYFSISCPETEGVSCALLINREDKRFLKGGGIIGLSYGISDGARKSALAECLQALELYLIGGERTPAIDFYLNRQDGGKILFTRLIAESTGVPHIKLGREYHFVQRLDEPGLFYSEVFIESALPIQLDVELSTRFPKSLKLENKFPVPLG